MTKTDRQTDMNHQIKLTRRQSRPHHKQSVYITNGESAAEACGTISCMERGNPFQMHRDYEMHSQPHIPTYPRTKYQSSVGGGGCVHGMWHKT